jgi:transposase
MSCGGVWSRCWRIRRGAFAIRAARAIRRGPAWRGSSTCSRRTRPGCRCPTVSSACPAARPVSAPGGVGAAGAARGGDPPAPGAAGRCREARLVAGDRRCLAGGCEKGGEKVARTLLGRAGSRYHLAVEAAGRPLEIRLAAGNENEQRHLLPLIDALRGRGLQPAQLWADRGYASGRLEQALRERAIEPCIRQPRRPGEPPPPGQPTREVWRGRRRRLKTSDPQARHRWPIERTNAWLKALPRIATRRDHKADNYFAFLQLGVIVILARSF